MSGIISPGGYGVGMDANWREGDRPCPECGAPTETGDWWDDDEANGGAMIGTLHRCTKCDWSQQI